MYRFIITKGKADILWECYKDRLGTSELSQMEFGLQSLLYVIENTNLLEEPFCKEEIDDVISNLPTNKSHGPDGFNGDFLKKC